MQSFIVKWKLHEEEKSSSPLLDAPPFPLSIAELLRNLPFSHRPSLKTVASRFKHHDGFIKCIMCPVSSETLQRNSIFRRSFDKHSHATTRKLTNIRPSNSVEAKISTWIRFFLSPRGYKTRLFKTGCQFSAGTLATCVVRGEIETETYRGESIHLGSLHQAVVVRQLEASTGLVAPAVHFSCVCPLCYPAACEKLMIARHRLTATEKKSVYHSPILQCTGVQCSLV